MQDSPVTKLQIGVANEFIITISWIIIEQNRRKNTHVIPVPSSLWLLLSLVIMQNPWYSTCEGFEDWLAYWPYEHCFSLLRSHIVRKGIEKPPSVCSQRRVCHSRLTEGNIDNTARYNIDPARWSQCRPSLIFWREISQLGALRPAPPLQVNEWWQEPNRGLI